MRQLLGTMASSTTPEMPQRIAQKRKLPSPLDYGPGPSQVNMQMNLKMETGEEIAIVENNYDDDEDDEDEDQYLRPKPAKQFASSGGGLGLRLPTAKPVKAKNSQKSFLSQLLPLDSVSKPGPKSSKAKPSSYSPAYHKAKDSSASDSGVIDLTDDSVPVAAPPPDVKPTAEELKKSLAGKDKADVKPNKETL